MVVRAKSAPVVRVQTVGAKSEWDAQVRVVGRARSESAAQDPTAELRRSVRHVQDQAAPKLVLGVQVQIVGGSED